MLRPDTAAIIVHVFVLIGQAGALLAGPALVAYGIDHGLPTRAAVLGTPARSNRAVADLSRDGVPRIRARARPPIILVATIGEGFLRRMRNRLFGHLMSLSLDYFETEKTGKIVARMTSDIDAMEELISQGLVLFVQNIFLFVGAVVVILVLSWQLALGVLVIVPPVYFASRWFRRVSNQAYLDVRDSISTNLSTLQEGSRGRAGRAGVRARAVVHPRASGARTKTSTSPTWRRCASRRSTSRSSSTRVSRRPR